MQEEKLQLIRGGLETAYINGNIASDLSYKPNSISNNYSEGKDFANGMADVIENDSVGEDMFIALLMLAKEIASRMNGRAVLTYD
ncbi:MAG: hypothetical protein ACI4GW_01695 [Lachnospiraceae bacterium]